MKLGFLGAGSIGSAIITGISTGSAPPQEIFVYDPDKQKCKMLEKRFERVKALDGNQAVLDSADCIFLCILPQIAPQVLLPLKFKKNHIVVSVVAVRPISEIKEYVSPAHEVIRAVPLPPIAKHIGPVIYYPNHETVAGLFAGTAHVMEVAREDDLIVLSAITGLIAPYYSLVDSIAKWAARCGVDERSAAEYSLAMIQAQSHLAREGDVVLEDLLEEVATAGGLNEQALRYVNNMNGLEPFIGALDVLLERLGLKVPER